MDVQAHPALNLVFAIDDTGNGVSGQSGRFGDQVREAEVTMMQWINENKVALMSLSREKTGGIFD